ncbi:MAG: alpha-galactosidase, partial [Thermogutta sp.]|nr:alpha-galactosidase [Thermogutta sp.]
TAPEAGEYRVQARFLAIDRQTTTSVHVLAGDRSVFEGKLRLDGAGADVAYEGTLALQAGATLDFAVGYGNGSHICDSTGLEARIRGPDGRLHDAARDFDPEKNPSGAWSYGWLRPGDRPDPAAFSLYDSAVQPREDGPRLLDLGNPEARQWLTDHIDRLLTEQGIDLYREDFNIQPLPFWRAADAPDRQGITENRYVTGHLAHWDELRRRHPDMLIDSCASGGRRNDLETMRRAVPLWRSDYAYEPIGHQGMTYGLSFWLPYHGTGTVACAAAPYYGAGPTPVEPYAFWSNVAPSLSCGVDIRVKDLDYDALRRLYRRFREVSPCFYGDYYPLTPYSLEKNVWIAWQFDLPEEGRGLIQAFRRDSAPGESPTFRPQGLVPAAAYALTQADSDWRYTATGQELMEKGFTLTLEQAPAAAVILYERRDPGTPSP